MSASSRPTRRTRPNRSGGRRLPSNITNASSGPTIVDRNREYAYIRRDLLRTLIWGGGVVVVMLAFYFLGVF